MYYYHLINEVQTNESISKVKELLKLSQRFTYKERTNSYELEDMKRNGFFISTEVKIYEIVDLVAVG